ncbi:MAG: DEAD/DEAH box helicase [Ardenticatenia bacterium]|nr:DEAD/DEAH box helicase [Ardenticatenia bacterium]
MNFEQLGLVPAVLRGAATLGYSDPTPIQLQAIPVVLKGGDVMGLAQTGTGKTAAFVLPMLQNLLEGPKARLRALIITPTRELADQVEESVRQLGQGTGLTSMTIYGGVGMQPQLDGLRRGRDVVVACPGRLLDHIQQGNIDLNAIRILVLDEADQMLDMGFFPTIRKILARLPARRQNLLFSATMPDDVARLAAEILRDPVRVQVGRGAPVETVAHALYPVQHHLKTALLKAILAKTDTDSVLVFTRTKYRAKRVAQQLIADGVSAAELQGNLSQTRRQAALSGFRDGSVQVLVATDIAARGIDVTQISHVINYDIPDTVEAYTHRIGRTGRAAKTGDAYTFVEPVDAEMIRGIEKVLRQAIPRRTIEGFDYNVAAPRKDTEFARPPREPRGPGKAHKPKPVERSAPAARGMEGHRAPHRGPEGWREPGSGTGPVSGQGPGQSSSGWRGGQSGGGGGGRSGAAGGRSGGQGGGGDRARSGGQGGGGGDRARSGGQGGGGDRARSGGQGGGGDRARSGGQGGGGDRARSGGQGGGGDRARSGGQGGGGDRARSGGQGGGGGDRARSGGQGGGGDRARSGGQGGGGGREGDRGRDQGRGPAGDPRQRDGGARQDRPDSGGAQGGQRSDTQADQGARFDRESRPERPRPILDKDRFRLRPEDRPAAPPRRKPGDATADAAAKVRIRTIDEGDDSWKRGEDSAG